MADRAASIAVRPTEVVLRDLRHADMDTLFEFQCDAQTCAMALVKPRTREAFDTAIGKTLGDHAAGVAGVVVKVIVVDEEVCGSIGCFFNDGLLSVGYAVGRAYWGRGIASRALALLLEEARTRPLYAWAASSNAASIRVLVKNGFVTNGTRASPETERYIACEETCFVLA